MGIGESGGERLLVIGRSETLSKSRNSDPLKIREDFAELQLHIDTSGFPGEDKLHV